MQNFTKNLIAAFLIVAFAVPVMASAETASSSMSVSVEMQAKIQILLQQIKMLQEQIKTMVASSSGAGLGWGKMGSSTDMMNPGQMGKMSCITLSRSLKQGDQGEDVKSLQQMLLDDPTSTYDGPVTGFFGPLTAKAMMHFQMDNGIASSTDGSVGPLTRGFFERRCGKGLDGMQGDRMGKQSGENNMMAVRGSVSANNSTSITISTNGGPVVANITASTTINIFGSTTPPTVGTVSNLTVGTMVTAMGTRNTDGSMQALTINIGDNVPMMKVNNAGPAENHGPMGFMPTTNGMQSGPGTNGYGPQNW